MSDTAKIIALDPGTTTMGLCVMTINLVDLTIVETFATTIHAKPSLLSQRTADYYTERQAKLDYLTEEVMKWVKKEEPITLVTEGPFYNMRRPGAFAPLVELLQQIKLRLRDTFELVDFRIYEPSIVKKGVGAKGNADKDQMKIFVTALEKEVGYKSDVDINDLDEHSIDSIAVAYTHFNEVRRILNNVFFRKNS